MWHFLNCKQDIRVLLFYAWCSFLFVNNRPLLFCLNWRFFPVHEYFSILSENAPRFKDSCPLWIAASYRGNPFISLRSSPRWSWSGLCNLHCPSPSRGPSRYRPPSSDLFSAWSCLWSHSPWSRTYSSKQKNLVGKH